MSSKPPDNPSTGRLTGEKSIFLNRVKQAAAQKLATASRQRSERIGAANNQAAATVNAAHKTAANVLSPSLMGAYALTDQGLVHADLQGHCAAPLSLGGSFGFVIDLGAQRIYWSELRVASGTGSPACAKQDQINFYPQPGFQGVPQTVVTPMMVDADFTNLRPLQLNFLPAGFQAGSIRLGPGTVLTIFEQNNQETGLYGRTRQFTGDVSELVADWPIDQRACYVVSHSYHCLMTANLDGTNATQLAGMPEINSRIKNSGALALDGGRGLLFWKTPAGQIMRVDFAGAEPIVISQQGETVGLVGLAVDTVNQNVYCSTPDAFGMVPYAGGQFPGTLVIDPRMQMPVGPFNYPNDWFTFAKPAIRIAVDAPNQRMYCSSGQNLWRAHLDGTGFFVSHVTRDQVQYERLYTYWDSAWGLALDQVAQMLYWITGSGDLMRMHVDPSLNEYQVMQSYEKVFTFQGLAGHPIDLAFFPSADVAAANQLLDAAHGRRQAAQTQAAKVIDTAHNDAATTRQTAQGTLDKAHVTAAGDISQAQQIAAGSREQAQSAAQTKRDKAAKLVNDANEDADTARSIAQGNAQGYIDKQQGVADGIKGPAQAKLDAARKQLQNS